ncbi:hypothetical protein CXU21_02280 [Akkermansia muciniphila]|nr:hypothetical protein CXU21_02280 [Akkermansia muciniphila]
MAMMSGLPSLLADMPPLQIGHARNDRIRSQILQVLLLFLVHEMLEGVPPIPSFCKTEGVGGGNLSPQEGLKNNNSLSLICL